MPHPLLGFGLSRQAALAHHLAYNHYPAVDPRWIPIAEQAIDKSISVAEAYDEGFGLDESDLDEQVGQGKTVRQVMDGLHLWDFVTFALAQRDEAEAAEYEPKAGE